MNKINVKDKNIDFDFKKPKKPKQDQKFDPSRKNKKFYLQKSYENF